MFATKLCTILVAAGSLACVFANGPLPPALPAGWTLRSSCQILNSASTLDETWYGFDFTPASCASYCEGSPRPQPFVYAGVASTGSGTPHTTCHCGYSGSYNAALSTPALESECNSPCDGNSALICGGVDRITVFSKVPAPAPSLPAGWSVKYNCAVDDGSRVLANAQVTQLANNSPAVCAAHCAAGGYRYAGVEYGNECQCGTGYRNGVPPQAVGSWECNKQCSGDPNALCGGSWRIQIYFK